MTPSTSQGVRQVAMLVFESARTDVILATQSTGESFDDFETRVREAMDRYLARPFDAATRRMQLPRKQPVRVDTIRVGRRVIRVEATGGKYPGRLVAILGEDLVLGVGSFGESQAEFTSRMVSTAQAYVSSGARASMRPATKHKPR